ncbi:unnamed protein product [Menidia menidia]|uniref:(Atlantic silverside) hypothetical protein n=1 Tax=Menidia menidia TaxID=238744 RepID=A0A8S4AIE6_9TELE|nr:unnamed protein product [Menidia menidia]
MLLKMRRHPFLGLVPVSVECVERCACQQKCSLDLWAVEKASCAVFLIFYEEGRSDLSLQSSRLTRRLSKHKRR